MKNTDDYSIDYWLIIHYYIINYSMLFSHFIDRESQDRTGGMILIIYKNEFNAMKFSMNYMVCRMVRKHY